MPLRRYKLYVDISTIECETKAEFLPSYVVLNVPNADS